MARLVTLYNIITYSLFSSTLAKEKGVWGIQVRVES